MCGLISSLLAIVCASLITACRSYDLYPPTEVEYVEFTGGVFPDAPTARALELVLNENKVEGNKWVLQLGVDRQGEVVAAREIVIDAHKVTFGELTVRKIVGEPHAILNGSVGGWELVPVNPGGSDESCSYGVLRDEIDENVFWVTYPMRGSHPGGWIASPK